MPALFRYSEQTLESSVVITLSVVTLIRPVNYQVMTKSQRDMPEQVLQGVFCYGLIKNIGE
jgi:hypothetical protein